MSIGMDAAMLEGHATVLALSTADQPTSNSSQLHRRQGTLRMAGPTGLVSGARQRTAARLSLALHVSIGLVALSIAFVLFDNSLFAW